MLVYIYSHKLCSTLYSSSLCYGHVWTYSLTKETCNPLLFDWTFSIFQTDNFAKRVAYFIHSLFFELVNLSYCQFSMNFRRDHTRNNTGVRVSQKVTLSTAGMMTLGPVVYHRICRFRTVSLETWKWYRQATVETEHPAFSCPMAWRRYAGLLTAVAWPKNENILH